MVDILPTQAASAYKAAANMAKNAAEGLMPEVSQPFEGPSFSQMVGHALESAVKRGYETEATNVKGLAGQAELHDIVTAVAQAEMTLNTVVAIRDRVITAYNDIIKMPI